MADDDLTPEEKAEAKRIAAEKAANAQKEGLFALLDEWADKRASKIAPPKTPAIQRPVSFLEGLFGSIPAAAAEPPKDKSA